MNDLDVFTEQNLIDMKIHKMKSIDKYSNIRLYCCPSADIPLSLPSTNETNFPITKLMVLGSFLSNVLIKAASETAIPCNQLSANILIDCGTTLNDENRMFNMMLICGLTQALDSLRIPYSVAVVADQNYLCQIKRFDEPHSPLCLQKICECFLIKRYKTHLANSVKFAIDYLPYYNERRNRAIFVFSDGINEELILTNSWSKYFFNNDSLSFGFIFIKPPQLTGENLTFVENIWTNFENEISKKKSTSIVKVISIETQVSFELTKRFSELFVKVLNGNSNFDLNSIEFQLPNNKEIKSAIAALIENKQRPIFSSVVEKLQNLPFSLDSFEDFYNDENIEFRPTPINQELYVKDLLKTQKILIVMLYDSSINPGSEDPSISPEFITKPSSPGRLCIKDAVDHFGITINIVHIYEDAIVELTKQTNPRFCDYYATWVFCGPPLPVLPEKNAYPNLVGQFNDVLIQFWGNGGSIVFWAEGEPFFYQVILFLKTVRFKNDERCPNEKTKLEISGSHQGHQLIYRSKYGNIDHPSTFLSSTSYLLKDNQRSSLSHNLSQIFEGISPSFAPYDLELVKPFIPFSRDSEGGVNTLFYTANVKTGTGDMIIDCGFSKCFNNMNENGTFRFIQNIASWTARPEIHLSVDNKKPSDWRPKAVIYTIKKGAQ